jgi:hypothetical protein
VSSTEKLDEYIRLTSNGLEPSKARQALRIPDKMIDAWMKDPKIFPRLESAIRMVAPPDVRDDEPSLTDTSKSVMSIGFYEFLTSKDFCNLTLSPAVRAIALASDARPDEIQDDALCRKLFGCGPDILPRKKPRVVVLRSGGQCGKTSRLGAPKVLHGAICVDLPNVLKGQEPRALITAPDTDLAMAARGYIRGFILESKILRSMLTDPLPDDAEDEESVGTTYRIGLRRPDKRLIDIRIKAANRSGTGGRSRTLTGALLDECAFYLGAEYKVSDAEIFGAVEPRVVPGGQTWLTTSANIEGYGLVEGIIESEFGKHETALVVLASTRLMFPGWDPNYEIETPMRKRDPDRAQREIDGEPLAAGETAFYAPAVIVEAERKIIVPAAKILMRGSGGDFAFVRNSSSLAMAESYDDGTFAVTDIDEQKPRHKHALRPSIVCAKHARVLFKHETFSVVCDGHYRESVREHFAKPRAICPSCGHLVEAPRKGEWVCEVDARDADELGEGCGNIWIPANARTIGVIAGPESTHAPDPFKHLRSGLNEGLVKLPKYDRLSAQLRAVEGKPKPGPGQDYAIRQPEQRNSGPGATSAHGDLVSAVVLALWRVGLGRESPVKRKASFGKIAEQHT